MDDVIIGIDLGTTNSMSAVVYPEGASLIKQDDKTTFIPSFVSYKGDVVYTGYEAVNIAHEQPERTFYSFKRFMGRALHDVKDELQFFPFKVAAGENDTVILPLDDTYKTPEGLSAEILKRIKQDSEIFLNRTVKKAVITIPAYFDDTQRQATKNAALLAGLEPVRIINEPTAAAIAYGLDQKMKGKILVYDLGGGTFDVSILELKEKIFRVISTNGNTHLGGDDFDNIIVDHIRMAFEQEKGAPFSNTPLAKHYLKKTAEQIKIELSTADEISKTVADPSSGENITYVLTIQKCEELLEGKINQTLQFVELALKDAKLNKEDIEDVVLVGGSTRIPFVRKTLASYFNKTIHTRINPDEVVAIGASIMGHLLSGKSRDFVLMDIIPLSLGIETIGGSFSKLIMKNSSIPAKITETYSTSVDNQTAININIYQGEREMVKDCRLLGKLKLSEIPPMPAGFPRLEVTFMVDNNGILSVTAIETRSEKKTNIEIIPEHGLNPLKVKQMIEDSIENVEADFTLRNLADFRVKAEMMINGYHKVRSQIKTILPEDEFTSVENSFEVLKNVLKEENPYAIKSAIDACGKLTAGVTDELISRNISQSLKDITN